MILEYLEIALFCLITFISSIILFLYRAYKYKVFDDKNFSKNFFDKLFIGSDSNIRFKMIIRLSLIHI